MTLNTLLHLLFSCRSRPGGHRKGYMGHLTRIANRVSDNMAKGNNADKIKEAFLGRCLKDSYLFFLIVFVQFAVAATKKKVVVAW